nr:hypothetical protein [Tanacetum cinerariifolium]
MRNSLYICSVDSPCRFIEKELVLNSHLEFQDSNTSRFPDCRYLSNFVDFSLRGQTHISQASGSGADEGTGFIPGVPDVPTNESEEEISWNSTDEEGNDEENLGSNVGREEGHDEEEKEYELYRDVNINQGRGIQTTQEFEDSHVTLTLVNPDGKQQSSSVSSQFVTNTYGDTVTLKRRRDDDVDRDKEPSAGSDRGSKRRREGKGPKSASAPIEIATRSAGKSTQGSKSRQMSASESASAEEPMQTTFEMEEPSHPEFETGADDQLVVESSQHPEWFSQQQKPPTLDRDWNKTTMDKRTREAI